MTNGGFQKMVVRTNSDIPSRSLNIVNQVIERRAAATSADVDHRSSSGLSPAAVVISVGVLFTVFVLLLFVGAICKVANRPKKEAAPFNSQKLYQPSAAGYGTRVAMQNGQQSQGFSSKQSLLNTAGPMGHGGRGDDASIDTSFETPSIGSHAGDYFGKNANSNQRQNGHTRGQSSGVQLPGATASVSSRKGANSSHPPLNNGMFSAPPPDGSGFRPGQVVNSNGNNGSLPQRGPGGAPLPPHARIGLGRPPAESDKRRSRYSRAASKRVESMGPGQLRKSVYLGADDDPMNPELYPEGVRPRVARKASTETRNEDSISSGLRRVDSVGKGDSRRKSTVQSTSRASRSVSIYNSRAPNDKAIFLSAQAEGFGAGRTTTNPADPLGARVNGTSPSNYLTAKQRSGSQNSSNSGGGSSQNGYSQRSPMSSNSPLPSPNGAPQIGKIFPSANGGEFRPGALVSPGATTTPLSFPGGGAPRIREGMPPMQVAGGGYDRSARQIL